MLGLAHAAMRGYRGGVSLRRLRYQLRCATAGHDTRPYLVGGDRVEHRCLRCGALVGDTEPAVSTVRGPVAPEPEPDALAPRPSELPAAPSEPIANGSAQQNGADDDDDDEGAALAALTALRELGELHASGVLTDAEFAAKKAELLRRV